MNYLKAQQHYDVDTSSGTPPRMGKFKEIFVYISPAGIPLLSSLPLYQYESVKLIAMLRKLQYNTTVI